MFNGDGFYMRLIAAATCCAMNEESMFDGYLW